MSTHPPLPRRGRVLYIGARIVGHRCLKALLEAGIDVAGLLVLDDSKAGITVAFQSFDDLIREYQLNSRTFTRLNTPELVQWAQELQPDLGIVVGVSQLVGEELLQVPQLGFLGMHPTLLPEGRGRAPIPWALIRGLARTGVSIFYLDQGADTGDLVAQREVPIYYEDTSATLGARTDAVAAELLVEAVPAVLAGTAPRIRQDESRATVWPRRRPEDGEIDWNWGRRRIYDWVRALTHPYPGAFTTLRGRRLWVWSARESWDERTGPPGTVLATLPQGVLVATGRGNVLLTRLQWEGEPEMDAGAAGLKTGERMGQEP